MSTSPRFRVARRAAVVLLLASVALLLPNLPLSSAAADDQPTQVGELPAGTSVRFSAGVAPVAMDSTTPSVRNAPALSADRRRAKRVLALVNQARGSARTCGETRFPAVPPVRRNAKLEDAAERYSLLMATRDFFSHTAPNGIDPGQRITRAGYRWTSWAENIAAGQTSPEAVVAAWLESEGHCRNIMSPKVKELGVGYSYRGGSTYGRYWVQNFGSR